MTRRSVIRRHTALDWRLFFEAAATLAISRVYLRRRDFRGTRAWAIKETRGRRNAAPVDRLVWSIEAATTRLGGATCLCKALALQRMLTRRGHGSELRLGVSKSGDALIAHAWLVHEGIVLVGGAEAVGFTLLAAWDEKQDASFHRNDRRGKRWLFS